MQLSFSNIPHVLDALFPHVPFFPLQVSAVLLLSLSQQPSVSPPLLVPVASFSPLWISPLPTGTDMNQ
jgi:hypothetical protein